MKLSLSQIAGEMLFADVMMHAVDRPLQQRMIRLGEIRVEDDAAHERLGVIDGVVAGEVLAQSRVAHVFVCDDMSGPVDVWDCDGL